MPTCHRGGDTDTRPGNGSPGSLTTWSAPHLPKGALARSLPLRQKLRRVTGCLLRKAYLSTPQSPPHSCPSSPAADEPLDHQANSGELEVRFPGKSHFRVFFSPASPNEQQENIRGLQGPVSLLQIPRAPSSGGWGSLGVVPPGPVL